MFFHFFIPFLASIAVYLLIFRRLSSFLFLVFFLLFSLRSCAVASFFCLSASFIRTFLTLQSIWRKRKNDYLLLFALCKKLWHALYIYNRYKKLWKYQNGKNAIFECWQGVLFLIKVGSFKTLNPLNFQKNKVNLKIQWFYLNNFWFFFGALNNF